MSRYNHVIIASCNGHIEIVKLLIVAGVDLKRFGAAALNWACINRQYDVIKVLLDSGVCQSTLYYIIDHGYSLEEKNKLYGLIGRHLEVR